MDNLKTSLYQKHKDLGAKIVPFGKYLMPLFYSGVKDEHFNTRNNASVFDVSHMGCVTVKGDDAAVFLNYITSNNVNKLYDSKIQYSCFLNHKGGIVDDLLIYMISANEYLLVINSNNIDKDISFMDHYSSNYEVKIQDFSSQISIMALQGPNSKYILNQFLNSCNVEIDLNKLNYYHFYKFKNKLIGDVIVSSTGYTGAGGFEIYVDNNYSNIIWDGLFSKGQEYGLKPAGLAARDTLRLEMGFCLYGNDINENCTPVEANLNFIIDLNKDFLGKDIVHNQISNGCEKKLIAFSLSEKGIPRKGYNILDEEDKVIGEVTSGTMSPSLSKGIGLAYIDVNFINQKCFLDIRGKKNMIIFEKLPFYKKK